MFGLGYQELLIILVIVLILFGANRLPELAKSLGSSVKEFKKGVNEVKAEDADRRRARKRRRRPSRSARAPAPLLRLPCPAPRRILHNRMRERADRVDYALAAALSVLTVLSRLPYRARMLYNWDAVQFALALSEYDVVKHQPHPPGYILYVALGRLVHGWLGDAAAAYVLLAVAFSGAGDLRRLPARAAPSTTGRPR